MIRQVASGRRYVDPEIAADALANTRSPLTDRELDVLSAGSRGETIGEIGAALEAEVALTCGPEDARRLAPLVDELRFLLISGDVSLQAGEGRGIRVVATPTR